MTDQIPTSTANNTSSSLLPESSAQGSQGLLSQSERAIQELRLENDRKERLLREERELANMRILGGGSQAGSSQPVITDEDKKKREALEFWKGSGIDKALAKYG